MLQPTSFLAMHRASSAASLQSEKNHQHLGSAAVLNELGHSRPQGQKRDMDVQKWREHVEIWQSTFIAYSLKPRFQSLLPWYPS